MTQAGIKALLIVIAVIILFSAIGFIITSLTIPTPTVLSIVTQVSPTVNLPTVIATPTATIVQTVKEATPSARDIEVTIAGLRFQPKSITARRGSTIIWKNNDAVAHTITASDGSLDSGAIVPGDSFEQRFDKIKSYSYFCNFHPEMKGIITIQ